MQTAFLMTKTTDPWRNLALEEHLLKENYAYDCLLFLWQNQNTVVIGKNQNAWKECNIKLLQAEGGKLARRSSGGGAVYHDLGNLNFTFIADNGCYDVQRQLSVLLEAVKSFDISAEFSGRNDLVAGGKKFSGNAFLAGKQKSLHHGTIMLNVDFGKLSRYLTVSDQKIRSKGVDSVRSRVCNLSGFSEKITTENMTEAIFCSFSALYAPPEILSDPDPGLYEDIYKRYCSNDWIFGKSPPFDISLSARFDWGDIEICLSVKNGAVDCAEVYSDAMDAGFIAGIGDVLTGSPMGGGELTKRIAGIMPHPETQIVQTDIINWLNNCI